MTCFGLAFNINFFLQLLASGILQAKSTKASDEILKEPFLELRAVEKDPLAFTPEMRKLGKQLHYKNLVQENSPGFKLHCETMRLEQENKAKKLVPRKAHAARMLQEYNKSKNLQLALNLFGYGEDFNRWLQSPWTIKSKKQLKKDQRGSNKSKKQ